MTLSTPRWNPPDRGLIRPAGALLSWLALLIASACMIGLLADYEAVWEQPENIIRHQEILSPPGADLAETLRRSFDWEVMEAGAPRLTRLLSNALDVVDFRFRTWFHQAVFPHPSVSITWLFVLGLTPPIIFLTFKELWRSSSFARYGVALYLSLPSTASLVTMHFRAGKSAAMFCMALLIYLLVRLRSTLHSGHTSAAVRRLSVAICAVYLIGLFTDEIALFSLFVILLLQDYKTNRRTATALSSAAVVLTVAYAVFIATLLPELHRLAGFTVDCARHCQDDRYKLLDRAIDTVTLRQDASHYVELAQLFAINAFFAVRDLTGTWNVGNSASGLGRALGMFNALAVLATASLAVFSARAARPPAPDSSPELGMRALFALFGAALVAHTVLMSVTDHPRWGIYWYGVFAGLPFLLLVFRTGDLIARRTRISPLVGGVVCVLVLLGNFHNFVSTNYAYKDYHYYPRRAKFLSAMFSSNEKFALAETRSRRFDLRGLTGEFAKLRNVPDHRVRIPLELRYLLAETRFCPWTHDYYHVLETDDSFIGVTCFSSFLTRLSADLQQQAAGASDAGTFRDLTGIYDDGGTPTSRSKAYVSATRDGQLVAVNGRGQKAALRHDAGRSRVYAVDWKLEGHYDAQRRTILWANGSSWERNDALPAEFETRFPK